MAQDENLKRYQDLDDVSLKRLEFGLWYTQHEAEFKKILLGIIFGIGAIAWTYTIYGLTYYLAVGMKQDDNLIRSMITSQTIDHQLVLKATAQGLQYNPVSVLNPVTDKYDFVSQVDNPNSRYRADFSYYYQVDGQATAKNKGFILPGESKNIVSLGEEFKSRPMDVRLVVEGLVWSRIDTKKIPDWGTFKNERLRIDVKDIKFTPARSSGLSENIGLSQLEFIAVNNSAYNFWKVNFLALMHGRGQLVGVNKYSVDKFGAGESRLVQVNYPDQLGLVDSITIIPEVDIMEKNNYMDFKDMPSRPAADIQEAGLQDQ